MGKNYRKIKDLNYDLFFSIDILRKFDRTFNFIYGGRGTGKTYGAILSEYEHQNNFLFMRRTRDEVDLIATSDEDVDISPFAQLNVDKGLGYEVSHLKKDLYKINIGENNVGLMLPLSTISKIRGFSASKYTELIFDEFVKEKHARPIPYEDTAFFNAYETINRNREMEYDGHESEKPIKVWLLSNSNELVNPVSKGAGLVPYMEKMIKNKIMFMDIPEKDATISILRNRNFEEKKKQTALYKLTSGTAFEKMSLENQFAFDDFSLVRKQNLREYVPMCAYGDIYIYSHKSEYRFYACKSRASCPKYRSDTAQDNDRFVVEVGRDLYGAFLYNAFFFESYEVKKTLTDIIC